MERWLQIQPRLKKIVRAPPLRRVNGIGFALLGRKREIPDSPMYFKGYWFTILFIPIIPICFYVVSGGYPQYRFHASMSLFNFIRTYRLGSLFYLLSAILDSVLFLIYFILVIGFVYGVVYLFRSLLN